MRWGSLVREGLAWWHVCISATVAVLKSDKLIKQKAKQDKKMLKKDKSNMLKIRTLTC